HFEQGTDAYHMPYLVQLTQDADLNLLEQAFNGVIDRHPVLKTVYVDDEQLPLTQRVDITIQQLINGDTLEGSLKRDVAQPFDLTAEPAIRLTCYQQGEVRHLLVIWHHIAFDGWSTDIFLTELEQIYHGLLQGIPVDLPALDISYGDYALWQRQTLQGSQLKHLLDYWQPHLAGVETLMLPTDLPRPAQQSFAGADLDFTLDADLSQQLRSMASAQKTTLNSVMMAGFYITLSGLAGQSDVVIGTPSDNRQHSQTHSMIGLFVNSLALRVQVEQHDSVESLIQQVHNTVMQAKVHQALPFEKLVEALDVERDPSRHPVYQVMFALQSFGGAVQGGNLPFFPV
ncbi:MAG: condensation domain-containing protein, partial [Psychrosphaera sp.]|nr:condensation domain-containing protein [Psychrosphaera sp.]